MNLKGVGVALVTPFQENGAVDFEALARVVKHVIAQGADYLVALGTTAETATLEEDEKQAVLETIIAANNKQLPLVLGVGGNHTAALVRSLKKLDPTPFDAILSVTPYYNKPSQEGLYQHYCAFSEASPLPIIVYNVPGRTGVNLLPQTFIKIASACENIVAIKEASGDLQQGIELIRRVGGRWQVLSGEDGLNLKLYQAGSAGCISVLGNAFPNHISKMYALMDAGNAHAAEALDQELKRLNELLFVEGNPTGIKALLSLLNLCSKSVRLPLVAGSSDLFDQFGEQLKLSAVTANS
jgi:4-hydroxy-tetrahydrodipicolinate synthase